MNKLTTRLTLVLIFVFLTRFINSAQTLSGRIMEAETKKPIPYVNIGIPGKNIGTVSDSLGNFSIAYKDSNIHDTLKVSCIGYESRNLIFADLIKKSNAEIPMNKIIYTLHEVVIKPSSKSKIKVLGNTSYSKFLSTGSKCSNPGSEIGVLYKNKQTIRIEKVNLQCVANNNSETLFRINIYNGESGRPTNNLLKEPIILKYRFKKGDNIFDLSDYNIEVLNDFFLSYETISIPNSGFAPQFGASLFGPKSLWRYTSQANWDKFPGSISFSVTVFPE